MEGISPHREQPTSLRRTSPELGRAVPGRFRQAVRPQSCLRTNFLFSSWSPCARRADAAPPEGPDGGGGLWLPGAPPAVGAHPARRSAARSRRRAGILLPLQPAPGSAAAAARVTWGESGAAHLPPGCGAWGPGGEGCRGRRGRELERRGQTKGQKKKERDKNKMRWIFKKSKKQS